MGRSAVEEIIQKKYWVTILAELREKLRIREGDRKLIIEPQWRMENPTGEAGKLRAA